MAKGLGRDMDAVTSFELEAKRRREVLAIDGPSGRRRVPLAETDPALMQIESAPVMARTPKALAPAGDCQPATAAPLRVTG